MYRQNKVDEDNFVHLYDTTLRDGSQKKGISFSLDDKVKIARLLDRLGVSYIEGGWPGSNPKDMAFFERIKTAPLKHSKVVAFGSTRKAGVTCEEDANLKALIDAETPAVTLVGKSSVMHVEKVLRVSKEENLSMISESIAFLKARGKEVAFDAEQFFDGYVLDKEYSLSCLSAAADAGCDFLVLCDTNGGSMPDTIASVVAEVNNMFPGKVGIHAHNDAELAVANSLAAVQAGARQIQGTINGYGERCGNANLISLAPSLHFKLGYKCLPEESFKELTKISRSVSEISNLSPDPYAPYVGSAAFAHKAGLHASAVARLAESYEHIKPETVGNEREILVSELAGRGNLRLIAAQLKLEGVPGGEGALLKRVKEFEEKGYKFEDAPGSVELMMRRLAPEYNEPFKLVDMMVTVSDRRASGFSAEAVVKVDVSGALYHTVSEGQGPVHALDCALRKALVPSYPEIEKIRLSDYKVRILDPDKATGATTRVVVEAACEDQRWSTVGCSDNIIEASCQALLESFELYLLRNRIEALSKQPQEVVA